MCESSSIIVSNKQILSIFFATRCLFVLRDKLIFLKIKKNIEFLLFEADLITKNYFFLHWVVERVRFRNDYMQVLAAKMLHMRLLASVCLALSCMIGCSPPSIVPLPDEEILAEHDLNILDISQLPPMVTRIMPGDTLQIVRDVQTNLASEEDANFLVRSDGNFYYPNAGTIMAAGRTPEEVAEDITKQLVATFRYPNVTINIANAPGNRAYIGGAVENPVSIDLTIPSTLDQAIVSAGGLRSTADSSHVALLRMSDNNQYQIYFADVSKLLETSGVHRPLTLQRGDMVFVPKSTLGNAIEVVDLYMNQLLPFTKSVGVGASFSFSEAQNSNIIQPLTNTVNTNP